MGRIKGDIIEKYFWELATDGKADIHDEDGDVYYFKITEELFNQAPKGVNVSGVLENDLGDYYVIYEEEGELWVSIEKYWDVEEEYGLEKQAKEEIEYLAEDTDAEEIIEITEDEEGLEKPDEKGKDEKDLEDVFYNTRDIASPTALETDEDIGDMPEIEPLGGPSSKPFDVPDVEETVGDTQTAYEMIQDSIAEESDAGQEYVEIAQQLEREKQPDKLRKTIEEIAEDEKSHREELKDIAEEMEGGSEEKKSESKPKEEKKDEDKDKKDEKKEEKGEKKESYKLGKEYASDKILKDAKMAWKIAYACEDINVRDEEEFVKGFEEGTNK